MCGCACGAVLNIYIPGISLWSEIQVSFGIHVSALTVSMFPFIMVVGVLGSGTHTHVIEGIGEVELALRRKARHDVCRRSEAHGRKQRLVGNR